MQMMITNKCKTISLLIITIALITLHANAVQAAISCFGTIGDDEIFNNYSEIKEGKDLPTAEYWLKGQEREGKIKADLLNSEDTLMLKSKYRDDKKLELNLDEIMGEDVLRRNIEFEGYKKDSLGELSTVSAWADISLSGVELDSCKKKDTVKIELGRVDPAAEWPLRMKLRGLNIKSEFIIVGGENYQVEGINLSIPFFQSEGINLKALRYDEWSRSFQEEEFTIDWVNRTVMIANTQAGIFVLVE